MRNHKTIETSRKSKNELIAECSGYSTVFDALFLLILVSLAGVLLMPSLQAEKQYTAAGYVTSSELDTYMLESLLACKLDDFEYEISPLSTINFSLPENSIVKNPSHTLFGKEQKHRTFADLTAEYLALSLETSYNSSNRIYNNSRISNNSNSSPVLLNPLAKDYAVRDSEFISDDLNKKFAGRFAYRFEAYWHPIEAFPMESRLIIGKESPSNAVRRSVKLSMPLYTGTPSKTTLIACVNDSVLETALNSSDAEASQNLSHAFNTSLDAAAREGAQVVVGLLFPTDYSGFTAGSDTDESFHTLLYGVSENSDASNSSSMENVFNTYFSETLVSGFQLDSEAYHENASATDLNLLKEQLASHVKSEIKKELESEFSGEINRTVYSIHETQNLSEAQVLRDSFIESVYRQINPGGARIVLSIWNPVS
ncbi:MAG: hypothetical protein QG646_895 [Euryarchaeota archaeon]|nr:hypothetical protein [Euryarchaeota archaeon]